MGGGLESQFQWRISILSAGWLSFLIGIDPRHPGEWPLGCFFQGNRRHYFVYKPALFIDPSLIFVVEIIFRVKILYVVVELQCFCCRIILAVDISTLCGEFSTFCWTPTFSKQTSNLVQTTLHNLYRLYSLYSLSIYIYLYLYQSISISISIFISISISYNYIYLCIISISMSTSISISMYINRTLSPWSTSLSSFQDDCHPARFRAAWRLQAIHHFQRCSVDSPRIRWTFWA